MNPHWKHDTYNFIWWALALVALMILFHVAPHAKAASIHDLRVAQADTSRHTYQCLGYASLGKMLYTRDELLGGRTMMPFPDRYVLDLDGDGYADKQYIDLQASGRCEHIVPVTQPGKPASAPYGGPKALNDDYELIVGPDPPYQGAP